MVVRLVDLAGQEVLAEDGFDNPQIAFGPDILARIHHADRVEGATALRQTVVECLNTCTDQLCRSCGISAKNLFLISVAGNTTMSHLITGLPVLGIIREPYIPAMNRFGLLKASDLGIRAGERAG